MAEHETWLTLSDAVKVEVELLGRAAAAAVDRYCKITGEPADFMPERIMQIYIFDRLGDDHPMVPEMTVTRLWRRHSLRNVVSSPQPLPQELRSMADWRIDLVTLGDEVASAGGRDARGLVELKRWEPSSQDQDRLETLLEHLPECRFGLRLTLVDVGADDPWMDLLRNAAKEVSQHFKTFDVMEAKTLRGRRCTVVANAITLSDLSSARRAREELATESSPMISPPPPAARPGTR